MMEGPEAVATAVAGASTAEASLKEVALVFLKLGTVAFGGPTAHLAMMEDEFVTRRQWLTREQFLDRMGAANLIPGPSSTRMAIFIGYEKRGWPGLVVAGCAFILPATIIEIACHPRHNREKGPVFSRDLIRSGAKLPDHTPAKPG